MYFYCFLMFWPSRNVILFFLSSKFCLRKQQLLYAKAVKELLEGFFLTRINYLNVKTWLNFTERKIFWCWKEEKSKVWSHLSLVSLAHYLFSDNLPDWLSFHSDLISNVNIIGEVFPENTIQNLLLWYFIFFIVFQVESQVL